MDSHSPRPYPFTDPDLVKKYIQELAKGGSQKAFKGVPELIEAIDQGMIWYINFFPLQGEKPMERGIVR